MILEIGLRHDHRGVSGRSRKVSGDSSDTEGGAVQDFRNPDVWRVAHRLALAAYREAVKLPPEERFGLNAQIRRSAVSIPSNVAEGCGRSSDADFARFLHNAMGSASELEYQILLAQELGFLEAADADRLGTEAARAKRMLASLLKRLKTSPPQPTADSR